MRTLTIKDTTCTRNGGRKDMFVDTVKTRSSKNFSFEDQKQVSGCAPNQQHQAAFIYSGLFLTLMGFVMKHSLQFMSIHCSVNVVEYTRAHKNMRLE